jgi:hypothetical protein
MSVELFRITDADVLRAQDVWEVSVTRRTTIRDSVNVVDDFYDIYG